MATQLIESMSGPWEPDRYHDSYRDRVAQLIEDKRQGRETVVESEAPEGTAMSDLLDALSRSVEGAKDRAGKKDRTDGPRDRPALADLTKAELAELAREHDISGRSRMSRDELAAALADAEESPRAS